MFLVRPRVLVAIALLLPGAVPAHAQLAQILVNGGFEAGPAIPPESPVHAVPPGSTALTGWTVSGGAVSIVTDNYWAPSTGRRSLALSSTGPGAIEQSFATTPGKLYRLTFRLSGEPFSAPTIKHLRVTMGVTVEDFSYDVTPAWHWDMHWRMQIMEVQAFATGMTLRFASLDAGQWGPAIDSVTVSEIPTADVPAASTLSLSAIAPDPVQADGRIAFTLPAAGHARLTILDVQGRMLARLADGAYGAGPHTVEFSPARFGARPGVCVAVLQAAGRTLVRRFTVLH
jgi:choice-of-anchor C domain-containing protein